VAWSIVEVARMAGVTSRTLRHYDAVGLVPPAYVASNGYRHYETEQLLRLQEVLLLRQLGLGLDAIAQVLAGQRDRVEALRGHEQWLRGETERLAQLADTVARTITHLEEGTTMTAEEVFEGFARAQARAEEDLVGRYGEEVRTHFATARERTKDWGREDYASAQARAEALDAAMAQLLRSGAAPGDPAVQDLLDDHHAMVSEHWTPDRTSYAGLGQLYVDDPRFAGRYEAVAPGLAEFYRDAMAVYAEQRLA
jgi:DNA-binding transcriptional MerR regulator